MAINRAVTFMGPGKLEAQEREFPKLQEPNRGGDESDNGRPNGFTLALQLLQENCQIE